MSFVPFLHTDKTTVRHISRGARVRMPQNMREADPQAGREDGVGLVHLRARARLCPGTPDGWMEMEKRTVVRHGEQVGRAEMRERERERGERDFTRASRTSGRDSIQYQSL